MSIAEKLEVQIVPETPHLGAMVHGVDTKKPMSDEVVGFLKNALLQYKVLFFKEQHLSDEEHLALAKRFGEVYVNPVRNSPSKFRDPYDDEGLSNVRVTDHFHADVMYRPEAPSFSFLRMKELPDVGGDTIWADLVTSYKNLSETFRNFLETLTVMQGVREHPLRDDELAEQYQKKTGHVPTAEQLNEFRADTAEIDAQPPWEAPLVRMIPETGEKNYWVSPNTTWSIKGMSEKESDAILGVLFRQQLDPKFLYRYNWGVGDIAFWDHRTTLHCGISDYGNKKRLGVRISICPNSPIPAISLTHQ